jgi:hypothetical protein
MAIELNKPKTSVIIMLKIKLATKLKPKLNRLVLLFLTTALIFANVEMRHAKAANAIFFADFKTYLAGTLVPLLKSVGAEALAIPVGFFLELIPWTAVVVFVGLVIWGGIQGYQDVRAQDFSALGGTVAVTLFGVAVILILDKFSSFATT